MSRDQVQIRMSFPEAASSLSEIKNTATEIDSLLTDATKDVNNIARVGSAAEAAMDKWGMWQKKFSDYVTTLDNNSKQIQNAKEKFATQSGQFATQYESIF